MTQYKNIAIDTSQAVFTLHGIDQHDRPVLRINLRRAQMTTFFKKLPRTEIAMEACGSAHHWARELTAFGHMVHLIRPQYVKPYVKRGKNDRNDAEAICEASRRPGMHFVPVKLVSQQAQGMVLKVRDTLIGQRAQLANTLRGPAAEFGVIAAKGMSKVEPLLIAMEHEIAIPPEAKVMAALWVGKSRNATPGSRKSTPKLGDAHKANAVSQRLATVPGVGPVAALTLAIEIDPAAFESARHLAALAGLTPQEHSTGGKQRMGGTGRAGNEPLRALCAAGATSVFNAAIRPSSKQMTDWLRALLQRKPRKLAAVALAIKMARVAWALMTSGESYRRPLAATEGVAA